MNKNIHSINQNTASLTGDRPLNAKYYPFDDVDLNGRMVETDQNLKSKNNLLVRFTIQVLSVFGLDL